MTAVSPEAIAASLTPEQLAQAQALAVSMMQQAVGVETRVEQPAPITTLPAPAEQAEGGEVVRSEPWTYEASRANILPTVVRQTRYEATVMGDEFRYGDPTDLWDMFDPPEIPRGLLPAVIDDFAATNARIQGSCVTSMTMAAFTVAANVLHKDFRVKVKVHDKWSERICIWTGLVGPPSAKKSPIISACRAPVTSIERQEAERFNPLWSAYEDAYEAWRKSKGSADSEPAKPLRRRLLVEDTTTEALQQVQLDTGSRLFCIRDELSGHFAAMDRYNERNGGSPDRAYWLETFNGGGFMSDRIKRGMGRYIECNMVGLLGGIQPDKIRSVIQTAEDDGMIQRMIPIIMQPSTLDIDEPDYGASDRFRELVARLHELSPTCLVVGSGEMRFDHGAQAVRNDFTAWLHGMKYIEAEDPKLASHIAKYGGIFARMCGAFHLIERHAAAPGLLPPGAIPNLISQDIASRVYILIRDYLLPHALTFYRSIATKSTRQANLETIAELILHRGLTRLVPRDFRGTNLPSEEVHAICKQLEVKGWLHNIEGPRKDSTAYLVNLVCHEKFTKRKEEASIRIAKARDAIAEAKAGMRSK